mmetsp:Transcript_86564/g.249785  ORF Transcript_86564/g.249785 Transcript_86564/m.249785 type:complete len:117 (+) Transcript_86564:358-708(+)
MALSGPGLAPPLFSARCCWRVSDRRASTYRRGGAGGLRGLLLNAWCVGSRWPAEAKTLTADRVSSAIRPPRAGFSGASPSGDSVARNIHPWTAERRTAPAALGGKRHRAPPRDFAH